MSKTATLILEDPCLPVEVGTEAQIVEEQDNLVVLNVKTEIRKLQNARYHKVTFDRFWRVKDE